MHFLFLGVFHKQLEIFRNATYAPKGRLKAFQALLEEADKNKMDSQDKVKDTLKKESVMLFDVCYKTLKTYNEVQPVVPKAKSDAKIGPEIEDIVLLLQRLFNEFPEERITEISLDDFYDLVFNLLRPRTSDKYKVCGFFLMANYMNLLAKVGVVVKEKLQLLFEKSLQFIEAVDDQPLVGFKLLPVFEDDEVTDRWITYLSKENIEAKSTGSLRPYFQTIQKIIETNPTTAIFWIDMLKKSWLKYFYPTIYLKCSPADASLPDGVSLEKGKIAEYSDKTIPPFGYYHFCPPIVHVIVCNMFLPILKEERLAPVKESICLIKENIFFMFEVLTQTFYLCNSKELQKNKLSDNYLKIRREFSIYLRGMLCQEFMPKSADPYKEELMIKIVTCIFSIFSTPECIISSDRDEFAGIFSAIDTCLRNPELVKNPDYGLKMNIHLFDSMLNTTEKIGGYVEDEKKGKAEEYFSPPVQIYLRVIESLITSMFYICLSPMIRNDQKVWERMRQFCKKWLSIQMLILIWQNSVVEATSTLSDNLSTLVEDDYKVLSDPELNPFEGLPMKKEYSLQVLYNAHTAVTSIPLEQAPEFIANSKYKHVYKTSIYNNFDLWLNLLKLIQLPSGFNNKVILSAYTKTLHGIIDAVVPFDKITKMREGKEHASVTTFPPPNNTIFDLFSPYLFNFYRSTSPDLVDVRNFTLKSICRLFCSNQCEVPLALGYLAHIVKMISTGLETKVHSTVSIIIQNTKTIFSLDYRGLLILIPPYLDRIKEVLEVESTYSTKAKNAAMSILSSLLTIPDHFEKYEIQLIGKPEKITMATVKTRIYQEVLKVLNQYVSCPTEDKTYDRIINKAVCCATVVVYQEASKSVINPEILKTFVAGIVRRSIDGLSVATQLSLSCLSTFAYLFPVFNQLNTSIIEEIFAALGNKLSVLAFDSTLETSDKQGHASNIINTLLELIMEDRYCALIKRKETFVKIVDSSIKISRIASGEIKDEALMLVEYIKEYYMNYPLKNQSTTVTSSLFDELEFYSLHENALKSFHRSFKPAKRRKSVSNLTEENALEAGKKVPSNLSATQTLPRVSSDEDLDPLHAEESGSARFYEMLKKASPVMMQLITGNAEKEQLKAAENPKTPTKSPVKDAEYHALWKAKTTHLAYGTEAIVSIIQSPYLSSRIIVRDLTGKHAWLITEHRALDYNCLNTIDYNDKAAMYKNVLNLKGDQSLKEMITENKGTPENVKVKEEKDKREQALKLEQDFKGILEDPAKMQEELKKIDETDTLARVLSLFSKHYADAKIELLEKWEKQETALNEKEIAEFDSRAIKTEESEQALYKVAELEHKKKAEEEFKADVKLLNKMYQSDQTRIDYARSFLCHIGDVGIVPSAVPSMLPKLTLLNEADPDFRMLVKYLDTECVLRRSIKLGVIYVERGQFDQKSILYNTKGSAKYEEMLSNLGKPVSKKDAHKVLTLQPEVLYYATATFELVFHVITMMTTNFNDSQQLEKKKYVGNDSVHIVWSENDREYKPGTITGSFNFAHIIVYPMRNGLYKIQVARKKDNEKKKDLVKFFGPLITGMILPMQILPSLLRYTAINARKNITFKQLQVYNPMTERRKTIEKIVGKYAAQAKSKNEHQFMLLDRLMHSTSK